VLSGKLAEILIFLLQNIGSDSSDGFDVDAMTEDLLERGYEADDINLALGWLLEHFGFSGPVFQEEALHTQSRRILHQAENHYLTPEARGYLAELQNRDLINISETEAYIEKAMWMARSSVSFEELQDFVSNHVLGQGRLSHSQLSRVVIPSQTSQH